MGLDISVLQPTHCDNFGILESFDRVTVLTYLGKYKFEYENLRIFEQYLTRQRINYFDISRNIETTGYIENDLYLRSGEHHLKDRFTWHFSQKSLRKENLMITPATEKMILNYDIRVKENRRYEFWWDYIRTMKTKTKKTSGKFSLELSRDLTYSFEEICLYHPQISYQRNGMNEKFYDDDIWSSEDIINKALVKEHIKKYALDKEESMRLLYVPFIPGQTFLRYW